MNVSTPAMEGSLGLSNQQHVVSWPSCLGAVIAVALNTMSQPSGRVLGYEAKYNFVLRSSPLLCVVSALDTLIRLFVLSIKERSLAHACDILLDSRLDDQDASQTGTFDELRKNRAVRFILFLFGAVPQAIKIYSYRGILCTQLLVTAYILPFVVDEFIGLGTKIRRSGNPPTTDRYARIRNRDILGFSSTYKVTVLWLSSGLGHALVTECVHNIMSKYNPCVQTLFPLVSSVLGCTIILLVGMYIPHIYNSPWGRNIVALVVAFMGAMMVCCWLAGLDEPSPNQKLPYLMCSVVGAPLMVWIAMIDNEREKSRLPQGCFALVHLTATALCYVCYYDSKSTYKPSWADYLG